jgi:iron complex outermembrane receptor protein
VGEVVIRLTAGSHTLLVTRIGYATEERPITLVAGRDTTVVVELEEEAVTGEEIVVVSTRAGRRIEDEPLRVEVVSREEVEEKLLMTPGDIAFAAGIPRSCRTGFLSTADRPEPWVPCRSLPWTSARSR